MRSTNTITKNLQTRLNNAIVTNNSTLGRDIRDKRFYQEGKFLRQGSPPTTTRHMALCVYVSKFFNKTKCQDFFTKKTTFCLDFIEIIFGFVIVFRAFFGFVEAVQFCRKETLIWTFCMAIFIFMRTLCRMCISIITSNYVLQSRNLLRLVHCKY